MSTHEVGYDPNDGILYIRSADNASLDDMLRGIDSLMSNSSLPRELRILEDGRGIHVTFPASDIAVIVERLCCALDEYSFIRHAVIHDDPKNTAFAVLLGLQVKHEKYTLKVFSTYKAARNWVLC